MSRILIVDNEPADALLLETILGDIGSSIRSVTDSRQAEQTFADFEPDLVLLDLHMADPDGLEILRRLSGLRSQMFVPVVVLTADATKVARQSALVLGADDFLTKPFDQFEVRLRVRNLLRTRALYVELAEAKAALEGRLRQQK